MESLRPKVGVVVLVFKDGKVLLGRRLGDGPGLGKFGSPGGHVEQLETLTECAIREVSEETGIEIDGMRFVSVVNVRSYAPAHFVMIVIRADWKSGEPQTLEPDRCEGWKWYALDELPSPLTSATRRGIEALTTGQTMFE